jgi:hypothetical protein
LARLFLEFRFPHFSDALAQGLRGKGAAYGRGEIVSTAGPYRRRKPVLTAHLPGPFAAANNSPAVKVKWSTKKPNSS